MSAFSIGKVIFDQAARPVMDACHELQERIARVQTMTRYTLRPYQREAVDRGVAYLTDPRKRGRNGLIVCPTGGGKSLDIAGIATALDGPCVVFQPSKEILQQNAAKLAGYGYKPALFSASVGRKEIGEITLATIGSVANSPEAFRHFRYVLIDECHLVNARTKEQDDGTQKGGMYREFVLMLEQARVLGLTATPFRLASNSLGSQLRFLTRTKPRIFHDVVHYTQIADLLRDGFLAKVEYREQPFDRDRLRFNSTGADYTDRSVQLYFREIGFEGKLQRTVEGLLAEGRKSVLVFTRFVEEAARLASAIPGAAVVSADTPSRERVRILEDFKSERIRVVSNVGVLSVGFDFPGLDTVVLARPSMSLALFYQMVGRCIRPHPSKASALVVDLVGLVRQFGRVEDLVLCPGGKTGEQWVIKSKGRDLTNCYFGEQAGAPGANGSGFNKRRYWAERASNGFRPRPRAERSLW